MNKIDLLLAQNKNFTFVRVNFTSHYNDHSQALKKGKRYIYKTTESFEIGDNAVVDVHGDLKIVRIVELDCILSLNKIINYKWLVCKVEKAEYNRCREVEKKLDCSNKQQDHHACYATHNVKTYLEAL